MSQITSYTSLTSPTTDDVLPIVDIHDTTMSSAGTTKQVTVANLIGGAAGRLTPTPVKTTNYTAAPGDLALMNTSGGALSTCKLPAAPADQSVIGWKLVKSSATPAAVTVLCQGSDVLNVASGLTSFQLTRLNQAVTLQYKASSAIWYVIGTDPALPLDTTAADIAAPGNQSAGATLMAADAGHVHPATGWTPGDHGLAAWTYDPMLIAAAAAPAAGTIYMLGLKVRQPVTVSNIYFVLGGTQAATVTAGENFAGLYSSATRLAQVSIDSSFGGTADALVTCAITPQALTPGQYWVAFLMNATTMPTLANMWGSLNSQTSYNLGLTSANYRSATGGTAATALPATTPTLAITGKSYWTAIG